MTFDDWLLSMAVAVPLLLVLMARADARKGRKGKAGREAKERVLFTVAGNPVTEAMACTGILVTGSPGSGKTSAVGETIARSLLRVPGCGGLVCPGKRSDLEMWRRLCREEGRELVVFGEGSTFAFVDYEVKNSSVDGAAMTLRALVDMAARNSGQSGERFWVEAAAYSLRMATQLLVLAEEPVAVTNLYFLMVSAPQSVEEGESAAWRAKSPAWSVLQRARAIHGHESAELALAEDWLMQSNARLSDKTRACIDAHVMLVLGPLLHGAVGAALRQDASSFTPEVVLSEGAVVYADFPALADPANKMLLSALVMAVQNAALRRVAGPRTPPVFLWRDEFQTTCLPDRDASVAAVARSHKLIQVNIVQSVTVLEAALGGSSKSAEAESIVSLLGLAFACFNTCTRTNEMFSERTQETKELMMSGGSQERPYDPAGQFLGLAESRGSASFSEQYRPELPPYAFAGPLRTGGAANGFAVDCYFFAGSRLKNGKTWVKAEFRQQRG